MRTEMRRPMVSSPPSSARVKVGVSRMIKRRHHFMGLIPLKVLTYGVGNWRQGLDCG